ncbi:MAG: proprotein convertase P-domain-containing protein, partial [Lentimicrobiaceae bacterium]|nr:proprotein convertase P-domain-containing protein [Lentimicrobiaceae bacterium]
NDLTYCDTYGGLYEWTEALQYVTTEGTQGICPEGWHIPADGAWKILEGSVDSQYGIGNIEWDTLEGWRGYDAGGNLKEAGLAHWLSPNAGATNSSGFTALPGGFRDRTGGAFSSNTSFSTFWSSTENNDYDGLTNYRIFDYNFASSLSGIFYQDNGFSIRCLKNCEAPPSQANAGPDQLNLPETTTTLAGNVPTSGIGIWNIVSGTGGTIVDPHSPTSAFQGLTGHQYTLSWTVYTACDLSQDLVDISIAFSGVPTCEALVDSRDGQSYATVQIGYQCWMAQNLNTGQQIESEPGGSRQTDNQVIEKYCSNDLWLNCDTYGGLYEWNEAMQYVTTERAQGICPFGWHLPADFEFSMLSEYLGGDEIAGGKMKATGTVEEGTGLWYAPNTGATNSSGFTGIPQGYRDTDGGTYSLGYYGDYWTSTHYNPENAWYRSLDFEMTNLSRHYYTKVGGSAVRCVKDCTPFPIKANAGPDQVLVPGTSTTLAGNTPTSGSGQWTIITGSGGTITDPLNPVSTFQGQACSEYTLRWTITTVCGYTFDNVTIVFAPTEPFSCGGLLEDCRDGKEYATVQIGTQCWMAENLNIGTMVLNNDDGQLQTDNGVFEKYCYDDDPANCETYGGLYEWREAMQYSEEEGSQGICPYGWYLPSDNEWTVLRELLGGEEIAGGKMKSVGTLEEGTGLWHAPNTAATNESGFTALPSGYRDFSFGGYFAYLGNSCDFWTSTQSNVHLAFYYTLYYTSGALERETLSKFAGFGIRCVQNCTPQPTESDAGPDQVIPGTTETILQGNTPSSGTGLWTIESGSGGTIAEPTNPNSEFQGTEGNVYILAWTITTSCGSSIDCVILCFTPCQNENKDYPFADLTDPLAFEGNSWTDAGWADVNVPALENQIVGCVMVTASQLCTDGYPEEVTLYLKSPAGTVVQIWEGEEEDGCTDDFIFMTEAFDGESSQGQWIIYFEDAYNDGGATCIGAVLHIGH